MVTAKIDGYALFRCRKRDRIVTTPAEEPAADRIGRSPWRDVRMRGFQDRAEVSDAVQLLCDRTTSLPLEPIELTSAAGRVLGKAVVAAVAVPPFDRAAMDGY